MKTEESMQLLTEISAFAQYKFPGLHTHRWIIC